MFTKIIQRARADQEWLPREIMAHRVSAEQHRHVKMVLGGFATVLTTLVGTAVFTGLVGQFGLDGKGTMTSNHLAGKGMVYVYGLILFLSILTPVVAAVHTFRHDAEDAATHQASAAGYCDVLDQLTIFLARFDNDSPLPLDQVDRALSEYEKITKQYNSVLAKSLTLTKQAYRMANKTLREQAKSKAEKT